MPFELNTGLYINIFDYISLLYTYFSTIVSKVRNVLTITSKATVCEGNSNERFLVLPSVHKSTLRDAASMIVIAYKHYLVYNCRIVVLFVFLLGTGVVAVVDSSRTGVPSLYYVNCEILIRQGTNRCDYCKKHRKSLCAMVSRYRKHEQTDNHTYLSK